MKLHKRLLEKYSTKNLKVYAIPQTQVIGVIGVRFTGGGHGKIYPQIPDGEIWIAEELMKTMEGLYYIYHELYEHRKMAWGMSYDDAHLLANKVEGKARKLDKKSLEELIEKEVVRNEDMIHEKSYFNGTLGLHSGGNHHSFQEKRKHHERRRPNALAMVK
jgi:hypothetical protein